MNTIQNKKFSGEKFKAFTKYAFGLLSADEVVTLNFSAENTMFTRMSKAKIRQSSMLDQGSIGMNYISEGRNLNFSFNYIENAEQDLLVFKKYLDHARSYKSGIPVDPYLVKPENHGESFLEVTPYELPATDEMISLCLDHVGPYDLAGVLTSGDMIRANANSLGQFHWFKTRSFYVDYSLYNSRQKAVKGLYAGNRWNQVDYVNELKDSIYKLNMMDRDSLEIKRGDYRVYLAPGAVNELVGMLSWNGVSTGAHKRGEGSLLNLMNGEKTLSSKFTLKEDFNAGLNPRFNEFGEVSPMELTLIENGAYKNFLTSTRTANEYGVPTNFASEYEGLRAAKVLPGTLSKDDILKRLDTGLYLSDLHYLNWSDRATARITGMTRYACFFVENGEIKAPIKDLRFDESLYKVFGSGLMDLTSETSTIPATGSYDRREIGGSIVPGALIDGFTFTL